MRLCLYTMEACRFCDHMKDELKRLPQHLLFYTEIDYKNIQPREFERLSIRMFPTLIWFTDDDRMIKKLDGFHNINDIIKMYNEAFRIEMLQTNKRNAQ